MAGGISRLVETKSSLSDQMFIHGSSGASSSTHIMTNINLTTPTNYIGTVNSDTAVGSDNGVYSGYLFILQYNNNQEFKGYLATDPDEPDWSANSTADGFNSYKYRLYSDVYLTTDISHTLTSITSVDSYTVYRESFISGDSIQIEQRVPTLDSVTLFPIPNASDTQGTENLRFVYYAFPSKPKHVRSPVGLPESYSEALITKAFEIAKRRETGMVEPYNFSLHRSTSGRRHLPDTPVRDRPGRIVRPGLYTNVPIN